MMQWLQKCAMSPSGEVALFVDDDQFGWGQSILKCGFEIVSLFWHSVQWRSGARNPYTPAEVHDMAHADYVVFNGPDVVANDRGMTDQELYGDIARHRFGCVPLRKDWGQVKRFLEYGYPVVIGGVNERQVRDAGLSGQACPYHWIKPGAPTYFHIILATGPDGEHTLKFRDTANVDGRGILRPGPRRYLTGGLDYTIAIALVPSWLPFPHGLQ
jgi:hypothetical protein